MKKPSLGPWISLNANYYIEPVCHPGKLLDDANLLLDGAHGIVQSLSDLLSQGVDVNPGDLSQALWGASTLIELGQRSAQEAHGRLEKIRNPTRSAEDAE